MLECCAPMDLLTDSLLKPVKNGILVILYLHCSDIVFTLRLIQIITAMKKILRKLAFYIVPLLIPVIEKLIDDAVKECKKKLSDQLKEESTIIQNQLRSK